MSRTDYQVEQTAIYQGSVNWGSIKLDRSACQGITIKGSGYESLPLCAANSDHPAQPRDRQWYLNNVINPMIASGQLDNGTKSPFDDQKLRYAGSNLDARVVERVGIIPESSTLRVDFGITHFKAFKAEQDRSDEDNLALQAKGLKLFDDRYAFFSRAPGVAVLPLFRDEQGNNVTYVGERTNPEAGGFLNAVAGHLRYREDPKNVMITEDLFRELEEEFGITREAVVDKPIFVGVYSHPVKGDLDFTFIAQTDVPTSYVDSGNWMTKVREREHKPLIKLATLREVQKLLQEEIVPDGRKFPLMYSTRGALESLTEAELRR